LILVHGGDAQPLSLFRIANHDEPPGLQVVTARDSSPARTIFFKSPSSTGSDENAGVARRSRTASENFFSFEAGADEPCPEASLAAINEVFTASHL
jgi:hypothetical protein